MNLARFHSCDPTEEYKHHRPYCPRFWGQNAVFNNCDVALSISKRKETRFSITIIKKLSKLILITMVITKLKTTTSSNDVHQSRSCDVRKRLVAGKFQFHNLTKLSVVFV